MSNGKTHIGILGIGAIGSAISCLLKANTSLDLYFYNRTPKDTIRVRYNDIESEILLDDINNYNQKLDWLIICLKEHQYDNTTATLLKLVRPQTKLVSIRNGLYHKEPLLKYTKEENILECIIDCPTQQRQDGFYKRLRKPVLTVPENKLARDFEILFPSGEVTIKQTLDFKTSCWEKVCESATLGAILCLSGETCWIFQDEELLELYKTALKESIQVAIEDGAKIEVDFIDKMVTKLLSYPPEKSSSMLTDRLNGKPIELGAKNEVIIERGKQNGMPTPINDLFVKLLKKINTTIGK
ncbi:ketopantoate reductase C-terminal domain-containing protein [Aquimarina algiphila]|uniref:ketopantoate reductase C-terminal domain-containing protein n=1 Tax=Aquimarina algiphila TaxID=2047982 RepID=UPI002493893F|nr:ketopantoate reductase C-terminal domain-containing protein [Aquimarina algiphila]